MCTFCPGNEDAATQGKGTTCARDAKPEDTTGYFLNKIIKIKCQKISGAVLPVFSCGFGPRGKNMDILMFLF